MRSAQDWHVPLREMHIISVRPAAAPFSPGTVLTQCNILKRYRKNVHERIGKNGNRRQTESIFPQQSSKTRKKILHPGMLLEKVCKPWVIVETSSNLWGRTQVK